MSSTKYPSFNDLTKEAKAFIEERKINDSKTIIEWLNFFTPLALFDKKGDITRRNSNYVKAFWAFGIVYGLYTGFLFMFSGQSTRDTLGAAIVIVVSAVFLILTNKWFERYEIRDIPNLLRGFVLPFLELMKKKAGGEASLVMGMDLGEIHDLEDKEAHSDQTGRISYMKASVGLMDSGLLELNIDGTGVKRPYYSKYKLRHTVRITNSYDSGNFQKANHHEAFQTIEKNNRISFSYEYDEQSESPIGADTGPDLDEIKDILVTMSKLVERRK